MTEQVGNPSEFESHDPELAAVSNELGELSAEFGFVETPAVAAARAAFLRGVPTGGFARDNPNHQVLLHAFHDAATPVGLSRLVTKLPSHVYGLMWMTPVDSTIS